MKQFVWPEELKKYHKASMSRSLWQLFSTLTLYLLGLLAMYESLAISYWLTILIAIPTSGFLVRLYIIFHDCVHGSFFRKKKLNTIVGKFLGHLTVTPFYVWKEQHLTHHRIPNNLDQRIPGGGDVWLLTATEYKQSSLLVRIAYRIYRSPLIVILAMIHTVFLRRFNYEGFTGADPIKLRNSLMLNNLFLALNLIIVSLLIGFSNYLVIMLPILLIASAAGCWLFYIQHQASGVEWKRDNEWDYMDASLNGSTYFKLPKILQWFTGNIGFHHVHHLHPLIPNYYLEKCHENHPTLKTTPPLTIWNSFKVINNKLWDEEKRSMVGF
jgi:omega-6 fatty acid desaturase (delta-12 desaturase)